jgi:hypothetical protein
MSKPVSRKGAKVVKEKRHLLWPHLILKKHKLTAKFTPPLRDKENALSRKDLSYAKEV